MTQTKNSPRTRTRPVWHADAKWVVGIVAFFLVAAAALVVGLGKLTERETAVTVMSTVMATMFSPNGLDEPKDVELVRAQLKTDPDATIEPLPGVTVTATEIEGKNPREIRLMIFRKLAEPIYDQGMFASTPTSKVQEPSRLNDGTAGQGLIAPTADQVGLLVLLSNESHRLILTIQTWLLVGSAILLLLLISLSTGFGRLASPGWVLLLVSGLPFALITLVSLYLERNPPAPPVGEPTIATVAMSAATDVAPTILTALRFVYAPLFWSGLGLLLVATLGGLVYSLIHRSSQASKANSK